MRRLWQICDLGARAVIKRGSNDGFRVKNSVDCFPFKVSRGPQKGCGIGAFPSMSRAGLKRGVESGIA